MRADAFIVRAALPLALAAVLAGCGLMPKEEQQQQAEAPPGTEIVAVNEAVDVPKDAQGQPVDKGDGPVLQALGSLAGVDLGQRVGGCTFQHTDGRDLLVTGAAQNAGVAARGAVRSGGVIVMLQTVDLVGLDGLKAGPTLVGGGLTIQVRPAAGGGAKEGGLTTWTANLGVTDAGGNRRIYSPGRWVCA
jgi:hypothetical protein